MILVLLVLAQQAFSGSYVFDAARSDDIRHAIDVATADLNFIKRPVARSRLRATNTPARTVTIRMVADSVEITTDSTTVLRIKSDGRAIDWRYHGEALRVTSTFAADTLTNTFVAEDGQRVSSYALRPDGALQVHVRITSPQLKHAVEYTLVFRRASS